MVKMIMLLKRRPGMSMAAIHEPSAAAGIAADEEKLFDRSKRRAFMVQEFESDMAAL